jgi:hypothetical protein
MSYQEQANKPGGDYIREFFSNLRFSMDVQYDKILEDLLGNKERDFPNRELERMLIGV